MFNHLTHMQLAKRLVRAMEEEESFDELTELYYARPIDLQQALTLAKILKDLHREYNLTTPD